MTTIPHDDIQTDEYRTMYLALREPHDRSRLTLRDLSAALVPFGSEWSIASWSKYERGQMELNLTERNALRRYYGRPDVPRAPSEIVADEEIARVIVMSTKPDVAVLVGRETHEITLNNNGSARATPSLKVAVTSATAPRRPRKKRKGITMSVEAFKALSEQRERLSIPWDGFMRLIATLVRLYIDSCDRGEPGVLRTGNYLDKNGGPVVQSEAGG